MGGVGISVQLVGEMKVSSKVKTDFVLDHRIDKECSLIGILEGEIEHVGSTVEGDVTAEDLGIGIALYRTHQIIKLKLAQTCIACVQQIEGQTLVTEAAGGQIVDVRSEQRPPIVSYIMIARYSVRCKSTRFERIEEFAIQSILRLQGVCSPVTKVQAEGKRGGIALQPFKKLVKRPIYAFFGPAKMQVAEQQERERLPFFGGVDRLVERTTWMVELNS